MATMFPYGRQGMGLRRRSVPDGTGPRGCLTRFGAMGPPAFGGTTAADNAAAAEQLRTATDELQEKYGESITQYGDAIKEGARAAELLSDSGASTEEVLNGVAAGIASAGAAIAAAVPGIGWIIGAATEVAAAILAAANWLVSSYPARPMDPAQAGVNHALRVLGYSTAGGNIFVLDTQALMKAASEGWFFYTRQRTTDETHATMVKRFPLDVEATLCSKYSNGLEYGQKKYWCNAELSRGGDLFSPSCVELSNIPVLGRERFTAIFGGSGSSGLNYPLSPPTTASKSAGALLWHWDDDGVSSVVAAWKMSRMPDDMQRAIKSAMLAPQSEWPNDRGVAFCLSQVHPSDSAPLEYRQAAAQRLVYVGKSVPMSTASVRLRPTMSASSVSEGAGVGTAVAVVGGLGLVGLAAWLALK